MTKIIVSMTSWSKRIKQAETTVKTLLEQTRKPDLLELNLDLENFPHGIPDLPKWVMEFREKYPNFKVYFRGDDIKVGYSFRRFFVNVEDESKLLDTSCGYPSEEFDKERKYLARI